MMNGKTVIEPKQELVPLTTTKEFVRVFHQSLIYMYDGRVINETVPDQCSRLVNYEIELYLRQHTNVTVVRTETQMLVLADRFHLSVTVTFRQM